MLAPPRVPSPPLAALADSGDLSRDGELWLLARETSAVVASEAPVRPCFIGLTAMAPADAQPDPGPSSAPERSHSVATPSSSQPSPSQPALRRTGRSNAGQHSNVHRLPQPVAQQGNGVLEPAQPLVHTQVALFRPWS